MHVLGQLDCPVGFGWRLFVLFILTALGLLGFVDNAGFFIGW